MVGSATTREVSERTPRSRGVHIVLWALQVLIAITFIVQGIGKIVGTAMATEIFDAIGAGAWFRYLIGALELAGAVGVLIPRLAGLAGLAFVGLMLGAVATHLFVIGGSPALPAFLLIFVAVVAWGRRQSTADLIARR